MKKHKKIISLLLAIIMMFSITSISYADTKKDNSTELTLNEYINYLEEHTESKNIFIKIVAKFVIIFAKLGFIKVEDFKDWIDLFIPSTDNNSNTDNNEEITELKLDSSQSLPYTKGDATLRNVQITKEAYDGTYINKQGRPVKTTYRHKIIIDGTFYYASFLTIGIQLFSTKDPTAENTLTFDINDNYFQSYYNITSSSNPIIDNISFSNENGVFHIECYMYNNPEAFDSFYIYELFTDEC